MEYARKFKFIRFYLQLRFDCDFNRCYLISRTFIIHQPSFHNIYHQRRIFYLLFTYYYYYFNYLLSIKNAGSIWKRNKIVIACEWVRWVVFLNAKKKKKKKYSRLCQSYWRIILFLFVRNVICSCIDHRTNFKAREHVSDVSVPAFANLSRAHNFAVIFYILLEKRNTPFVSS